MIRLQCLLLCAALALSLAPRGAAAKRVSLSTKVPSALFNSRWLMRPASRATAITLTDSARVQMDGQFVGWRAALVGRCAAGWHLAVFRQRPDGDYTIIASSDDLSHLQPSRNNEEWINVPYHGDTAIALHAGDTVGVIWRQTNARELSPSGGCVASINSGIFTAAVGSTLVFETISRAQTSRIGGVYSELDGKVVGIDLAVSAQMEVEAEDIQAMFPDDDKTPSRRLSPPQKRDDEETSSGGWGRTDWQTAVCATPQSPTHGHHSSAQHLGMVEVIDSSEYLQVPCAATLHSIKLELIGNCRGNWAVGVFRAMRGGGGYYVRARMPIGNNHAPVVSIMAPADLAVRPGDKFGLIYTGGLPSNMIQSDLCVKRALFDGAIGAHSIVLTDDVLRLAPSAGYVREASRINGAYAMTATFVPTDDACRCRKVLQSTPPSDVIPRTFNDAVPLVADGDEAPHRQESSSRESEEEDKESEFTNVQQNKPIYQKDYKEDPAYEKSQKEDGPPTKCFYDGHAMKKCRGYKKKRVLRWTYSVTKRRCVATWVDVSCKSDNFFAKWIVTPDAENKADACMNICEPDHSVFEKLGQ